MVLRSVVITHKVSKGEKVSIIWKSRGFSCGTKKKKKKKQIKLLFICLFRSPQRKVCFHCILCSLNHHHMKNKPIMLNFFISKGMLDLEFFYRWGSVALWAGQGGWRSGILTCNPGSAPNLLCDTGQVSYPACATTHHRTKIWSSLPCSDAVGVLRATEQKTKYRWLMLCYSHKMYSS